MYKNQSLIVIAPAYNEEAKIGEVVRRMPHEIVDKILVVNDGSNDNTAEVASQAGATVINLEQVRGVGYAIRSGFEIALQEKFDLVVVIAGNNKDNPLEIPALLDPICDENCDFVMGSRFLKGGRMGGDMPFYRKLATRLHPWLLGLFCGKKITESTNGFRAMKLSVLRDKRINLYQKWLESYELEVYLLMKILMLGYLTKEVPCTKIYPARRIGQTKMRPILDWWKMLRPIFYTGLRVKH